MTRPPTAVCALVGGILAVLLSGVVSPRVSGEERASGQVASRRAAWDELYGDLLREMEDHGPDSEVYQQHREQIEAGDPTVHDLIWPGDRHPVDVLLRRTRALWATLAGRIAEAKLASELGQALEAIGERVAADATGDRELFRELCALRRRIAFADPAIDFDALVFLIFSNNGGGFGSPLQSWPILCQGRHPEAGIYRVRDLRGDEPVIEDVLETARIVNGRLQGETGSLSMAPMVPA